MSSNDPSKPKSVICKEHEIASSGDKTKYNVAGHATQEIIL